MRKCLDIQFYDIFLAGQQLLEDSDRRVSTGAPDQFTRSCPSRRPNVLAHGFPRSWPHRCAWVAPPNRGWWQRSFVCRRPTKTDEQGWLIWTSLPPVCFGPALLLVLGLTYDVQFELMDTPCRSTSEHHLSHWFGAMPIIVVSSIYYMEGIILCRVYRSIHF